MPFLSQLRYDRVKYLFQKPQAVVIEIKSKIGHGCILNTSKSIPKIASFIVVYLVGINSQTHSCTFYIKVCPFFSYTPVHQYLKYYFNFHVHVQGPCREPHRMGAKMGESKPSLLIKMHKMSINFCSFPL